MKNAQITASLIDPSKTVVFGIVLLILMLIVYALGMNMFLTTKYYEQAKE
jgi:hypothetical protein